MVKRVMLGQSVQLGDLKAPFDEDELKVYKLKVKEFIVSDLEAIESVLCHPKARDPTMGELIRDLKDQKVYNRRSTFQAS